MSHDHEIIEPQNPAAEAREYALYFLKNGRLPAILDWKIANAFKFAWGPVMPKVTRELGLGASASWGDVHREIGRREAAPEPKADDEITYIGDFPPTEKELRLEAAQRKAGIDAAPTDWRSTLSPERA